MDKIAETGRLILRKLDVSDARDFYNLNADPEVLRYTGDKPFRSPDEAVSFLRNYREYEENGFGRWAVIARETNAFVGWCGLKLNEENLVDLGFRFFREEWGKGYATESAQAALAIGFNAFDVEAIIGRAVLENEASVHVLEKLGMTFWKHGVCNGIENAAYYKISKTQYGQRDRRPSMDILRSGNRLDLPYPTKVKP